MLRSPFRSKFLTALSVVAVLGMLASSAQALTLRVNQNRRGTISSAGGEKRYTLRITNPGQYVITADRRGTSSPRIDPKVTVRRGSRVIGTNDDGGEGLNSRLVVDLSRGTYTVVVEAVGSSRGQFTLRAERQGSSGSSSGGDQEIVSRGSIRPGQSRTGSLDANEAHEYTFRVRSAQDVVITANKSGSSSRLDPKVYLLRGSRQIAVDDDGGGNRNARLSHHVTRGTYTIRVTSFGTTSGRYRLRVEGTEDVDVRGTLSFGSSRTGNLDANEEHAYRLRVSGSTEVTISVDQTSGSSLDPRVAINDSDGDQIGFNDDGGEGRNALLSAELSSGTYTVIVSGFGTTSGRYRIRAERGASSGSSRGTLRLGGNRTGNLSAGETDRYTLRVTSPTSVRIDVEKTGSSSLDPKVVLRSSGGGEVGRDDDGGQGNNARLIRELGEGTYTVLVSGFGQTHGGYRVSAETQEFVNQGSISVGEEMDGYLESGEVHRFSFYSRRSGSVTINVNATDSPLDPKVAVQDADGSNIGTDDDGGEGTNSRLTVNVRRGRYYILVQGFGTTSGEYFVSVE